jgi:hypothetical protein
MSVRWWHILLLVAAGYAIGYYWPAIGKMTLGKLGINPAS